MRSMQLQVFDMSGYQVYHCNYNGDPATTSHVLAAPVAWSEVMSITMAYADDLNNSYIISFQKP